MLQKQRLSFGFLLLGLLLLVTACGASANASGSQPSAPNSTPTAQQPTPTPTPVLPHTQTRVVSIHMVNNTSGWVLCADGSVLRSTDGGLNWVDVTPAMLLTLQKPQEEASQFSDASNAWVAVMAGNGATDTVTSFHTSDAGQTWQEGTVHANIQLVTAGPYYQVAASSKQEAWIAETTVMGGGGGPNGGEFNGSNLYHTTDSGKTWAPVHNLPANPLSTYRSAPVISFANQQVGMMVSVQGNPGTSARNGTVYLTQNGGASWSSSAVQSPDPAWQLSTLTSPQFLTANDGVFTATYRTFATEGVTGVPDGEGFSIFNTHDGGQTWTSSPIVNVGTVGGAAATKFFTSQQGYVLAYVGQVGQLALYTTNDGGKTWTSATQNLPDPVVGNLDRVGIPDFTSLTTGWALLASAQGAQQVFPTSLYTTVDGGQTWTQVHAHFPSFITPPSAY